MTEQQQQQQQEQPEVNQEEIVDSRPAVVLYSRDTKPPVKERHEYQALRVSGGLRLYIRKENHRTNDLLEALNTARPRDGETILNSVHIPNSRNI